MNLGSFTFLCAVACRGCKNEKVPKYGLAGIGLVVLLCLYRQSIVARHRVSYNDLRLKEVGAFEAQIFFWKPHFKCKTNFH